jgi:hypothetical protein
MSDIMSDFMSDIELTELDRVDARRTDASWMVDPDFDALEPSHIRKYLNLNLNNLNNVERLNELDQL